MPLCAVGFDAERNQRTFFYRIDAGNYCFCKEICIGDNMVGRGPATRAIPVHSHRGLVGAAFLPRLAREDCILTANLQTKLSSDFKTSWNLDEEERASNRVEKLLFLGSSRIYPKPASQPMPETALMTGPLEATFERGTQRQTRRRARAVKHEVPSVYLAPFIPTLALMPRLPMFSLRPLFTLSEIPAVFLLTAA
jgi:hypothetical protein